MACNQKHITNYPTLQLQAECCLIKCSSQPCNTATLLTVVAEAATQDSVEENEEEDTTIIYCIICNA